MAVVSEDRSGAVLVSMLMALSGALMGARGVWGLMGMRRCGGYHYADTETAPECESPYGAWYAGAQNEH